MSFERKRDYELDIQRERDFELGIQRERSRDYMSRVQIEIVGVRGLERDIGGYGFIEMDRLGFMGQGLRQIKRQIDRVREKETEVGD